MHEYLIGILLGLVEGITEFLPISSTGHLIIAGHLLQFEGARAESFEIFIQLGAILAVVVLYWKRFIGLLELRPVSTQAPLSEVKGGFKGWSGITKIAAACVPAFILGAILHKAIKSHLFSPYTVAIGFIVGGILFILVERKHREPKVSTLEKLNYQQALIIGIFQCLALWPGMSRSGSTILGGLIIGCSRQVAAEFSFLVAVPVMCAAVTLDLLKSLPILSISDLPLFAIGFVVSFLSALVAIKSFIGFLSKYTLVPFAIYRIVVGLIIVFRW